ncbi:MAG: low affinity iron permease family protein [Parachlamydiaceae bacterium]|nr:MAG: low affinity iron permease family protein [Parachlamydiaceae bacterium]
MRMAMNLTRFMNWSAKTAGKPITFVIAWGIIFIWVIIGLFWGFTSGWLLVIDTLATLNASLMVFIIQNTQNRESRALHIKIDELIRATEKAENTFMALEEKEESEIESIRHLLHQKLKRPKE